MEIIENQVVSKWKNRFIEIQLKAKAARQRAEAAKLQTSNGGFATPKVLAAISIAFVIAYAIIGLCQSNISTRVIDAAKQVETAELDAIR